MSARDLDLEPGTLSEFEQNQDVQPASISQFELGSSLGPNPSFDSELPLGSSPDFEAKSAPQSLPSLADLYSALRAERLTETGSARKPNPGFDRSQSPALHSALRLIRLHASQPAPSRH